MTLSMFETATNRAVRRRVFVSYHHAEDQAYYSAFSSTFGDTLDVISDRSMERARDSNDPEYIMRYIREHHLTGASTILVLCGTGTPFRKFVDWEISAALRREMSLIGVRLPSLQVVNDACAKNARLQDNIDSGYAVWTSWDAILRSGEDLVRCIEDAASRPKSRINNARLRRLRNG